MRAAFLAFALFLFAGFSSAESLQPTSPDSVGLSTERLAVLKTALEAEIAANRMPGVVVMIARKGKLAYSEAIGFADKDRRVPMRKDTIFRIYSMTKPLVAVVTMTLAEEGKIDLLDPVAKYLPAFAKMTVLVTDKDGAVSTEPAAKPITILDLLRHTSGIDYGEITTLQPIKAAYEAAGLYSPTGTPYDSRGITPEAEVDGIAKAPLSSQPGTNWKYSLSYDILGRVLEAATGKRLGALIDERLFRPLRMGDSGFFVPSEKWARIAQPLAADPLTGAANTPVMDVKSVPGNDSGGAGGVSTATDYLRFCQMLLNGGALDGKRILSPAAIRLMTSDQLGERTALPLSPGELLMGVQGYTFGLGFMVRKGPGLAAVPGSEGEFLWGGAAGTFFWVDPKQELAVVIMTQTPGGIRAHYRRLFKQLVSQAIVN